jgi:hypothetical protein
MKQFVYRVDAQDRIQFVDANWLAFAVENGTNSLTQEAVTGSSLWTHISDVSTRHLYRTIMNRVRSTGRPMTLPFRCDLPERRRYMALGILRGAEMALEFRSYLLREESTQRVSLLDAGLPHTTDLLRMCSWCKKVDVKDGSWQEPDIAVRLLRLFEASKLPLITHVSCPVCEETVLALVHQN